MKKYVVHYNYYATVDVEVFAESEEEAKEKANQVCVDPRCYDFSLDEQSIIDMEDGIDLPSMVAELTDCVKHHVSEYPGEPMSVGHYVYCEVCSTWTGAEYVPVLDTVTGLIWNEDAQSLVVSFKNHGDMHFDELAEIDQYYLAKNVLD